ncbi:hypothetical protein LXL04_014540 [Taraxacum kok-saghyz]
MIYHGGKILELRQRESSIFNELEVMVIEDTIYLLHVKGLTDLIKLTINKKLELEFVDLEHDPQKEFHMSTMYNTLEAVFITLSDEITNVFLNVVKIQKVASWLPIGVYFWQGSYRR